MKVLGISGTIVGEKTSILVNSVIDEIKEIDTNIETKILDLRDYDMEFSDGREFDLYNEDTKKIIVEVSNADAYLIGSPIFNGSIPAPLKNVFDLIDPSIFRQKLMGFVANGGTYQHYLMIENQLKPIAGYFRSHVSPCYIYAHDSHFNPNNKIIDDDLLNRIHNLAQEMVFFQKVLRSRIDNLI
ncbi:NADPH-dependent FMN reductase [Virgibacillus ihumii]|uniref:NADPH-dependent FMN reductase n=1 Tax=Virgibacillus ihumii TaxID=2686091 RepID=UPI00157E1BD5|nr:NADPH-dependent FMN reductase [Virgibacillus ihumii]